MSEGYIPEDTVIEVAPATSPSSKSDIPLIKNHKMWSVDGDVYVPCNQATDKLQPGQYIIKQNDSVGYYFVKKSINLDGLIDMPDDTCQRVIQSMQTFWGNEHLFRRFQFLWKRGIMLYGPPGSGKTSLLQQLSSQIVNLGGISIYCTCPRFDSEGLRILRTIEPDRPIVVILEDIDSIVEYYGEADLLALLDGELQIDNVVYVATTNYPEKLDKRITNRPSRFDEVIKIGMPNNKCRAAYLRHKNPSLSKQDIIEWVELTKGFSIAHMRELIVSVECLGNDLHETVNRLRKMIDVRVSSEDTEGDFGFIPTK